MKNINFNKFYFLIAFIFLLFLISILRYLIYLTPSELEEEELRVHHSLRNVILPLRGSIFKNRKKIAWSVRHLGLFIKVPRDYQLLKTTLNEAQKICDFDMSEALKKCLDKSNQVICLKTQLTVDEAQKLENHSDENSFFFKKLYEKRYYDKKYKGKIGAVKKDDKDFLVGYSGLEKKFNKRLVAKQAWIYEVIVNSKNVWIAGTYKEVQPAIKGNDVILSSTFFRNLFNE